MGDDEPDNWADFDSGPFCRHWVSPPGDCDEKCADCCHLCREHGDGACDVCACKAWREGEGPAAT